MTTATSALLLTVAAVSFINGCSAFSLLPSSPSLFQVGRRNNHDNKVRPLRPCGESRTALSMGIRSFIKRKFLGSNSELDDEDNDEYNLEEEEDVTLRSIISSFSSTSTSFADEMSSTDDISPGKKMDNIDTGGLYEDTNERIRRIKTGGMTEEEKARFLNTALTGALPKQKPRGPPIRQTIPPGRAAEEGEFSRSSDRSQAISKSSSSSSAKDNLWQALTTKKDGSGGQIEKGGSSGGRSSKDISVVSLMMDEKSKGEEAKRKYLASVTNPDRFNTFSTYKKQQPTEIEGNDNKEDENVLEQPPSKGESEALLESSDVTSGSDFAEMKRQIAEDRALLNPLTDKPESSAARVAVESILNMINSNNDKKTESAETTVESNASQVSKSATNDLAARLGQAAEEQEKRDAEARIALDKKREEQKQHLLEIQMRREEEARIREMERVEKARRVAEEDRRKKSEKENAEKAAMAARQAMQDEYWAKMLEKERVRKGGTNEPIEIKEKGSVMRDSQLKIEQYDEVRVELLDDNKKEVVRPNVETILSAARVSRPVPRRLKDEITESPFVREQRLKKEEIDRLRQVDMQSLKSLNSPIPSLSKVPPPPTYRAPPMPAPIQEAQAQAIPVSSSPPSPAQQQQPLNTPVKRIVRQQAIIRDAEDDDDDDDDETFSRSSAPGLTVADALKNRRRDGDGGSTESGKTTLSAEDKAKQWGIDMSRFN